MPSKWIVLAIAALLVSCAEAPKKGELAKTAPTPPPEAYRVRFETSKGVFVVEVQRKWAPRGADHFYKLIEAGFYTGVRFHRVIRNFVVQFGINGDPKVQQLYAQLRLPDDPVVEKNRRGTITYAKLGPQSRTTQVFINLKDNSALDKDGFAPFGKVVEGMEVVDSLYYAYGELSVRGGNGPDPGKIETMGEDYLESKFPRLDRIVRASASPLAIQSK